jgi:hypothetical protein
MCHEGQALVFQSAALTAELQARLASRTSDIQRPRSINHQLLDYFF